MNAVAVRLIAKDLYLNRWLIGIALLCGVLSLIAGGMSRVNFNFGSVFYLTTVIAYGVVLVMHAVVQERKDKSLVFVLSLPLSPAEYLRAKMLAMLATFVAPWAFLSLGSILLIAVTPIPDGMIPQFTIVSFLMLMNFCLVLSAALLTTSEPLVTFIIIVTNVSVSLLFMLFASIPSISEASQRDAVVWLPTELKLIAIEVVVTLAALSLPFVLRRQQRGLLFRS
jgi:ABC-type transport system involved in multi-copper enzyme maturation permease subunit